MTTKKSKAPQSEIDKLNAAVAKVIAMNLDDPKNQMTDEEFAAVSEDTTNHEEGKITTISRK